MNDACERVTSAIRDATACGIVDVIEGRLIGAYNRAPLGGPVNQAMASAIGKLWQTECVSLARLAGERVTPREHVQELHLEAAGYSYFALELPGKAGEVVVLVRAPVLDLGHAWRELRSALRHLQPNPS